MQPLYHTRILALGHRARQGKDSAVKILEQTFPGQVRRFAFSTLIYAVARSEYGMTTKNAALLQQIGDEKRALNPNFFVDPVVWSIADWDNEAIGPQLAVITDLRFQNEFERIKSLGGTCVRIQRVRADGRQFIDDSRPADHPSEMELAAAPWDLSIDVPECRFDVLRRHIIPVAKGLLSPQSAEKAV